MTVTQRFQLPEDRRRGSLSQFENKHYGGDTNSTASDFSDRHSSPARSVGLSEKSIGSNHSEVLQTLLLHKAAVLSAHPNPPPRQAGGYPPIKLLGRDECAKQIGYKEKKIPFRMRVDGDIPLIPSHDLSMRSCISRDASARSMYSCLPAEGESRRVLPREMSRRARMQEKKTSRTRIAGDRSPANFSDWKVEDENTGEKAKVPGFMVDIKDNYHSASNEALLDNSGPSVQVQVTRRATIVDIEPFAPPKNNDLVTLENKNLFSSARVISSTRGRSVERRGENHSSDRSLSNSAMSTNGTNSAANAAVVFSSRAERAAFFMNLKKDRETQRSPSPWDSYDRARSPEPTSHRSSRSAKSTTSKKSSYSHFGASNNNSNRNSGKIAKEKFSFVNNNAFDTDSDFLAARMGGASCSAAVQKTTAAEQQSTPILDKIVVSTSRRSSVQEVSVESSCERQSMAKQIDFEKVDVDRFSREPSVEPVGRLNDTMQTRSRQVSQEADVVAVQEKLNRMVVKPNRRKEEKKFIPSPRFSSLVACRSRSASPEPENRSRGLLAAGPATTGIGFRRSRSPVAVRQA